MSFQVVPAQLLPADYLVDRARDHDRPVRVGGHSKGGALALYAAMAAPADVQERILAVHNNDGPGLSPDIYEEEGLDRLVGRIQRVVPQFPVIGMLFDRGDPVRVVASSARGLAQHDLMTWQVVGCDLDEREAVSERAIVVNRAIASWLDDAPDADRKDFTEGFFQALGAGGATLITDIGRTEYGSVESVLLALRGTRHRTRRLRRAGVRAVWSSARGLDYRRMLRERSAVRAGWMALLGVYLMSAPALAVQVLGSFAVFAVALVLVARLVRHFFRFQRAQRRGWVPAAVSVAVMAALVLVLMQVDLFIAPTNVLLGSVLLAHAWATGRRAHELRRRSWRRSRTRLVAASALVSLLLGIVALSSASRVMPLFVMVTGQYLLVVGLGESSSSRPRRGRSVVLPASWTRSTFSSGALPKCPSEVTYRHRGTPMTALGRRHATHRRRKLMVYPSSPGRSPS